MEFSKLKEPIIQTGPDTFVIGENPLDPQMTLTQGTIEIPEILSISGVNFRDYISGDIIANNVEVIQETLPFIFFSNAENNQGVSEKTYYQTPVENKYLSGVTVSTAEDMKITVRWNGPNNEYIGNPTINGQAIPFENITELGTDTRRFEGYIDNLNLTGHTEITGKIKEKITILPLTELGLGPTPTNILIDSIENATPKQGEVLGSTHLKQGDVIDVFVDFNRDDVQSIKIFDSGLAEGIDHTGYSLQNIDNFYRATIPVTVSSREGDLSVLVEAIDNFGSTGELRESSFFNTTSGSRDVDQTYPEISSTDPTSYNGRSDGLREGESTTFENTISNWQSSTDSVSYTALSTYISIDNSGVFEQTKNVHYETGIYSNEDNVEIYAIRTQNGATDTDFANVKIANGPVIISAQLDSFASSATSPHITGESQVKQGDIVNSVIEIDGNESDIEDISISVLNQGIADGSQTSASSSYQKTTLNNGNFQFTVPINVFGTLGQSTRDGNQPATFTARNNFGTISDSFTTTDTAEVHNATIPIISFTSVDYPATQQAIKSTESATVNNTVTNFDELTYSSPNNQLSISNIDTYNQSKQVTYLNGGYNVKNDGGSNNIRITATRLANGAVISNSDIVNIANTPLTISINNLAAKIKTSTTSTSDNFNLSTNQLMLSAPSLSTDSAQTNSSVLSQTNSGTGKNSNSYTLTVSDSDTKGIFNWQVSARNLANIETTTIQTNPEYVLEGFNSRTLLCSPTSLGAGLADIGTTVTNPNNINFENVSEGGTASNGGTIYTYQSYSNGIQLSNSFDENNKFTICDSSGVTNSSGSFVFNLDKLNRAANTSTSNPARFIVSE